MGVVVEAALARERRSKNPKDGREEGREKERKVRAGLSGDSYRGWCIARACGSVFLPLAPGVV